MFRAHTRAQSVCKRVYEWEYNMRIIKTRRVVSVPGLSKRPGDLLQFVGLLRRLTERVLLL